MKPASTGRVTLVLSLIALCGAPMIACAGPGATITPPGIGQLAVVVAGLPAGINGSVDVNGPGSFAESLVSSETLTALAPGAYTIRASSVTAGPVAYTPQPAAQTITISAGTNAAVTITYSGSGTPPPPPTFGELAPGFQARSMNVQGTTYNYQIFVPQGYTPTQKWPVILFLHGSGERGSDNQAQTNAGLGPYVKNNASTFPTIVIFPQLPSLFGGTPEITSLLDSIAKTSLHRTLLEVHADSTRIYLTGVSLGGFFGWDVAYELPTLFAAYLPIAGGPCPKCITGDASTTTARADSLLTARLLNLPVWAFHGDADPSSSVTDDRALAAAFMSAGSTVYKYTEYPGGGHNVWDITYANPATWTWLFAQHR